MFYYNNLHLDRYVVHILPLMRLMVTSVMQWLEEDANSFFELDLSETKYIFFIKKYIELLVSKPFISLEFYTAVSVIVKAVAWCSNNLAF